MDSGGEFSYWLMFVNFGVVVLVVVVWLNVGVFVLIK